MATVKIGYSAFSNISFRGIWDTGIERAEWDEMPEKEHNEIFNEILNELITIEVIPE